MPSKLKALLIGLVTLGLVAFAGCVQDEQQAQEDIGQGIDEPEEDAGPTEEEIAPNESDDIGDDDVEDADGLEEDEEAAEV